jgi:hypothetical protein
VPTVAFPWVGSVVKEVEAKFHQTALSKAASESGMLIINAGVHYRHADTTSEVAFLAQLVDSGHDVREVIVSVVCATASETVRGDTTADGRAMSNARNLSLRLLQLPDGRDLLHTRP